MLDFIVNVLFIVVAIYLIIDIRLSIKARKARARAEKLEEMKEAASSIASMLGGLLGGHNHEDAHEHFKSHGHVAGEAIAKDDLVFLNNEGLLMKAGSENKVEEVDLKDLPPEVRAKAEEIMKRFGAGSVKAIGVKKFSIGIDRAEAGADKTVVSRHSTRPAAKKIITKKPARKAAKK